MCIFSTLCNTAEPSKFYQVIDGNVVMTTQSNSQSVANAIREHLMSVYSLDPFNDILADVGTEYDNAPSKYVDL